jgi:putative transcriptional regulator
MLVFKLYRIVVALNSGIDYRCKLYMTRLMRKPMPIKWRLAVLMADREMDYKELALQTGMHHVTVSKHKNMRIMPERLERETLEKYCKALKCQPGDLLVYLSEPSTEIQEMRQ